MAFADLKGTLALIVTFAVVVELTVRHRRLRTMGSLLQLLGAASFVVVAFSHVFEELSVFPGFGWGQSHSIGHYIDLGAAIIGLTLVFTGFLLQYIGRVVDDAKRCR